MKNFNHTYPSIIRPKFQLPSRACNGIILIPPTDHTHLPHIPTDDDGSVCFEELTKYVAQLSLMESRSESPDSDASEDDPALTTPTDSLTTPTLEVATVAS